MPLSVFAKKIGVSARTVQRWVYEGTIPNEKNTKKIEEFFNLPDYIIFYEINKNE